MKAAQLKYIRERIYNIKTKKISEFRKSVPHPTNIGCSERKARIYKAVEPLNKKIKAVIEKELKAVKVKGAKLKNLKMYTQRNWDKFLSFINIDCFEWDDVKKYDKLTEERSKKIWAFEEKVEEEAQKIEDELVLGDEKEALKLLEQFTNKKIK